MVCDPVEQLENSEVICLSVFRYWALGLLGCCMSSRNRVRIRLGAEDRREG